MTADPSEIENDYELPDLSEMEAIYEALHTLMTTQCGLDPWPKEEQSETFFIDKHQCTTG